MKLKSASKGLVVLLAIAFCLAFFLTFKFGFISKAEPQPILAPTVGATNVVGFAPGGDTSGDGRADPGDTLEYTVTVNSTGMDATGVIFNDTIDANTTLVVGSVNTSPIAFNDTYSVSGNIQISVPDGGTDLLGNDIDPDTLNNTGLTASAGATSAQGGNVVVNANGSFTYNPPPGFEGADNFTYTVTDPNGNTGTGTVTLNVSGMIWFVNASAGAGGNGRLTSPFNCYTGAGCFSAVAADDAGDNIFLYSGSYTGGYALLANQKLIGQGVSVSLATVAGITLAPNSNSLPGTGGARPNITNGVGNGITLNSGNTIRGLNASGSGFAIDDGGTVGALSISEVLINSTGGGFRADNGGTPSVTLDSLTAGGGANGINIANTTSGSFNVTGAATISNTTGDSISLNTAASTFQVGGLTQVNTPADTFIGIHIQNGAGAITFANIEINGRRDKGFRVSGGTRNITTGAVDIDNSNSDATTAFEISAPTGGTYSFGDTDINNNNVAAIGIQVANNCAACPVSFAAGSTVAGANGTDFDVNQGAGNITFNGTLTNTAGGMISVQSRTGGTIDFQGNLSHTGASTPVFVNSNTGGTVIFSGATKTLNSSTQTAVNLTTNTGATVNFTNGGLDIDTTGGIGFNATGGGTINVTTGTNANTIDSTTGTALNVANTTIGASGLTFRSISSNGSSSGIILNSTGAGGLTVTGNGGSCTTGTPANCTMALS